MLASSSHSSISTERHPAARGPNLTAALIGPAVNLRPRYNGAPGQNVAAVRSDEEGCRLSMLRWGLIPSGATEPNIGYRLINTRAETVSTKPAFRAPYRARRCLIPADGFSGAAQ